MLLAPSVFMEEGERHFSEGVLDQFCAEVPPFLLSEESMLCNEAPNFGVKGRRL